jgi:hypothetical protein
MLLYLDDHDCKNGCFFRVRILIRDRNGCFNLSGMDVGGIG